MDSVRRLAHDVRAPLHAARLAAFAMRGEAPPGLLASLEASIQEALSLVAPAQDEDADLGRIVDEVIAALATAHAKVRFTAGALPTVSAAGVRARRVVQNLLDNAGRYAASQVRVYWDAGLHIVDDGPGIPEVPAGKGAESAGEGLGWAACRDWAEMDGAALRLGPGPGGHVIVTWAKKGPAP